MFAGAGSSPRDVWVGQSMNRSRLCDRAKLWLREALSRDVACVGTIERAVTVPRIVFSVVEGLYTAFDVGCSHV